MDQGVGKEYGKLSKEYFESVAICQMDPEDMEIIGVNENDNVKVITNFGSVVIKAVTSARTPHHGVAFIPYGPWANLIMGSQTHSSGMPSLKGISAEIEPAPEEEVLGLPDILKKYYGKE